jgi:hypothetical protein
MGQREGKLMMTAGTLLQFKVFIIFDYFPSMTRKALPSD